MTVGLNSFSKKDLVEILEFISHCAVIDESKNTNSPLDQINRLVPAEMIAAIVAEYDGDGKVRQQRVHNISYPKRWIDIYEKQNYSAVDPIVKHHFKTYETQKWSATKAMSSELMDHVFWEEASGFGLTAGLTLGIAERRKKRASLFSFQGAELEAYHRHAIVLEYVMPYLHEAFFRSVLPTGVDSPVVTSREKEILKWLKCGKTNWEIAQILTISERTVKFHLTNLADKLDARSRSHIVAVALSQGLIDF